MSSLVTLDNDADNVQDVKDEKTFKTLWLDVDWALCYKNVHAKTKSRLRLFRNQFDDKNDPNIKLPNLYWKMYCQNLANKDRMRMTC